MSDRAKHYLVGKPLDPHLDFFDEASRCIEETDCPNIMVWGTMRPIPALRWRFPDKNIVYAQRFFDHSYDVSNYYNYCDIVLMQTYGTGRFAFESHSTLQPLVLYVPNGVELEIFHPVDAERQRQIRRNIGIPENKFVILFPSKLHPNKGTVYLLYWIEHFRRTQPDVHFLVAGGWDQGRIRGHGSKLIQLLEQAENVTWLGGIKREEMPACYQSSDICLMPAVYREGMSMVVQESLASGVPIIVTDRGVLSEIVEHEYNGLLCRPEELYRDGIHAIQRLMKDTALRTALGKNARRYAEQKLSRQRCLDNF